ncbi:V-type ATP synthase subunit D [Nitrincola sp.]|uniref:V-type ATP synthase subunit D n=1 Tax=Nitrincola sp. TaxID=1926584 RepID=UPI003A90B465
MGRLALNKSTLNKEGRKVKAYQKFVPALDLKRKQLLAARVTAQQKLLEHDQELIDVEARVKQQLRMLSNYQGRADELVRIKHIELVEVNLVGIRLPELRSLELVINPYSCLGTEHWLDKLASQLQQVVEIKTRRQVLNKRLELLNKGLQKTTQRLNLFDKVLIPKAQTNIRKIRIALADAERAGVVRAKIAKNKRQALPS